MITARIDPLLKDQTEQIFKTLGLTTSEAITLFLHQVNIYQGLPFNVSIPNHETLQALEDARLHGNLSTFRNVDALFLELEKGTD
jgi:DNA-damage-inducible protein J